MRDKAGDVYPPVFTAWKFISKAKIINSVQQQETPVGLPETAA